MLKSLWPRLHLTPSIPSDIIHLYFPGGRDFPGSLATDLGPQPLDGGGSSSETCSSSTDGQAFPLRCVGVGNGWYVFTLQILIRSCSWIKIVFMDWRCQLRWPSCLDRAWNETVEVFWTSRKRVFLFFKFAASIFHLGLLFLIGGGASRPSS